MKVFLGLAVFVSALAFTGCSHFGHKHGGSCCGGHEKAHDASHKCDCGGCKDGACDMPEKK